MPLFLEPNNSYPIVLDCDTEKPADVQPTFLARSMSMRDQVRVAEVLDLWTDSPDITVEELFNRTIDLMSEIIVGWRNMGGTEFSAEALRNLTYSEARELLRKTMYNQHITPTEKKS